jgi:hypothetical protein
MKFLKGLSTGTGLTNLGRSAENFVRRSQRRGLAVVVSDLFDPAGYQRGLDVLRHHRYEPHVVQVFDRREADPAIKGDVELLDVESYEIEKVTVTERNLRQYRRIFDAFVESVGRYCATYGIGGTRSTTDIPFDELILRMMREAGALT